MRQARPNRLVPNALVTSLLLLAAVSAPPGHADSYDRNVSIVNRTSTTLVQFYSANASAGGWGYERLRGTVIPPGGSLSLNFEDGTGQCRFHFKAVFANGQEKQNRNVDVCQQRAFRFQ